MATRHERIFAWGGVIVAVIMAGGLSAAAVIQQIITNQGTTTASTPPQTAQTCTDSATEPTLPTPEVYKPAAAVTSLQTTDLAAGSGAAAKSGDCLIVKYYGTLATSGTEFDENFSQTSGFAFTLGQGQVIPGWDQGLAGMQPGGMRRLVIPASLAYGDQANGAIPANAALVFVVKLLRILPQ